MAGLPVFLDEFDKNKHAGSIMEGMRGSSCNQVTIRGTASHKPVQFAYRHIAWLSGIHANLREQADENRFIFLELLASKEDTIKKPEDYEAELLGYRILASAITTAKDAIATELILRKRCEADLPQTRWAYLYAVPFAARAAALGQTIDEAADDMNCYMQAFVVPDLATGDMMTDQESALNDILLAQIPMPADGGSRSQTLASLLFPSGTTSVGNAYLEQSGIKHICENTSCPQIAFYIVQMAGPQGILAKTQWSG
jgi:hypothetical protein